MIWGYGSLFFRGLISEFVTNLQSNGNFLTPPNNFQEFFIGIAIFNILSLYMRCLSECFHGIFFG